MTSRGAIFAGSTLLFALLALARAGGAQPATLLRDIRQEETFQAFGAAPVQMVALRDKVVFSAFAGSSGNEVWGSDGTDAGTRMLSDACPGSCSGWRRFVGALADRAFWLAGEGEFEPQRLFGSDGTPAGTFQLTPDTLDLSNVTRSVPTPFGVLGSALYFLHCGFDDACQLWASNGTVAGTRVVTELPGHFALAATDDNRLAVFQGKIYFFIEHVEEGLRLWRSDGTAAGTVPVKTLDAVGPRHLTAAGKLFFTTSAFGPGGSELWASDGTAAGTRAVTAFESDEALEGTAWLKPIGNRVYFIANDVHHGYEIWGSDGRREGTRRATDFGYFHPFPGLPSDGLAEVGGRLVFKATDGLTPARLWTSTGTPESTAPLAGLCTGCPASLTVLGSRLYFFRDGELMQSDGTPAGTRLVRTFPGTPRPAILGVVRGALLLLAGGGDGTPQLWTSDGSGAGTRALTHLPEGDGVEPVWAAAGDRLFFSGSDPLHGREIWVVDARGDRLVTDIGRLPGGSGPGELTALGEQLFFTANDDVGRGLWVSSGTAESTTALIPGTPCCAGDLVDAPTVAGGRLFYRQENPQKQLLTLDGTSRIQLTHLSSGQALLAPMVALGSRLFFAVRGQGHFAIWQSDGTAAGTREVVELSGVLSQESFTAVGNELYFRTEEGSVYRSDGTAAGTRDLGVFGSSRPHFTRLGAAVYFYGWGDEEFVLYRSDGAGATRVRGFGYFTDLPGKMVELAGRLYFFLWDGEGLALWRSDGTEAGTVKVRSFPSDRRTQLFLLELVAAGGRLFFTADDGEHGLELWASDGTAAGTVLARDIRPGLGSSDPRELAAAGGRLFFSAHDGLHGYELWASDGTAAGTRMIQDLAPLGMSSYPQRMTAAGNRLYFMADDGLTGPELWTLPLAPSACQPSPHHLCLAGGRFRVEAAWQDFAGRRGLGTAVPLAADTGAFWFFAPENVEAVIKVLDARGVNGHFWVFYGALSSVEYSLTVTDTQTGLTRRYYNPSGQFASVGDTSGFGPQGARSQASAEVIVAAAAPPPRTESRRDGAAKGVCQASARRLCLNGGRFAVEVSWKDFTGRTGTGTAVPLTADTGTFWFFDPGNLELVLKVLDGTPLNGRYWVFYGALSSVEYTITVTDTVSGVIKTYRNPSGQLASVGDTAAF